MPDNDMPFNPGMMRMWRPTTQETKEVGVGTEVAIPLLQGLALIVLVWMASSLSVAALTAWGGEEWQPFVTLAFGLGLTVLTLHTINALAEAEQAGRMSQPGALGRMLLLVIMGLAGLCFVFYGLDLLLSATHGLDVEIVRWWVAAAGTVGALGLGLIVLLAARDLRPSLLFMCLSLILAVLLYLLMPKLAMRQAWPWMLTLGAAGLDLGTVYLFQRFRREILTEWTLHPYEKMMLKLYGRGEEETEAPFRQPVLVNGRSAELLSDEERERERWKKFVLLAALDSTVRRLKRWGFSYEREIVPWRDLLIEAGLAEGAADGTWKLTHSPEKVLQVFSFPETAEADTA